VKGSIRASALNLAWKQPEFMHSELCPKDWNVAADVDRGVDGRGESSTALASHMIARHKRIDHFRLSERI
jgi:hypothetical protein